MQDYHKLDVWRRAHENVLNVRRATERFPRTGYSSLKDQMIRAGESIPFNIVEGCSAKSQKDFARFLDISIKSTSELQYQLALALDYTVMAEAECEKLSKETVGIRKMLCGLRKRVLGADP
jgi:four helix bundle protein